MIDDDESTNITNRSGGADLNAEGDVNVGGDVVGRDKIIQATTYIEHATIIQSTEPPSKNPLIQIPRRLENPGHSAPSPADFSEFGHLSFACLEECQSVVAFELYDQAGNNLKNEKISKDLWLTPGIYNIRLLLFGDVEIGKYENLDIQGGQELNIDLTHNYGGVVIVDPPEGLAMPIMYSLRQHGGGISASNWSNCPACLPHGMYNFAIPEVGVSFDIAVEAGSKRELAQEIWSKVGFIYFENSRAEPINHQVVYKVYEQLTGKFIGQHGGVSWSGWLRTGMYKLVLTEPLTNYILENVEVKAGERVVIQLPTMPGAFP
jgi:hypothetical protein